MRTSLLILLSFTAVLHADSLPPSLVWTGDPTISISSGQGFADATPTGINSGFSCFRSGGGCFDEFTIDRGFTVTAPGNFVLTTGIDAHGSEINCNPGGCQPSAKISMSINAGTVILFSGLTGQDLSDLASSTNTENCDGPPLFSCTADVHISDVKSDILYLGLGDYTLHAIFSTNIESFGDLAAQASFDSSLVPTPEPRGICFVLAIVFLFSAIVHSSGLSLSNR